MSIPRRYYSLLLWIICHLLSCVSARRTMPRNYLTTPASRFPLRHSVTIQHTMTKTNTDRKTAIIYRQRQRQKNDNQLACPFPLRHSVITVTAGIVQQSLSAFVCFSHLLLCCCHPTNTSLDQDRRWCQTARQRVKH